MSDLVKKLERVVEDRNRTPAPRPTVMKGAPSVRRGEDIMSSRPFYLSNLVGITRGIVGQNEAKIELEQSQWFRKAMDQFYGNEYSSAESLLIPVCWKSLPSQVRDSDEGRVMKAMVADSGRQIQDYDAVRRILKADQSAYADNLGSSFVAPPAFGEPIELLRNEEVFLKAGAQQIALPPQGSIQYPRLTSPTLGAAQPEAVVGSYSNVGTDSVTLTAKAYSVFVRMSNQLIKFAPALASNLINSDAMKSLSLLIDLDALEGAAGGQNNIKGLINYANINRLTASKPGSANAGDTIGRKDGKRMLSKVYASNAKFTGWIMRYEAFLNDISELSADAVTAGDQAGAYLYNILRGINDQAGAEFNWLKFPVNCSNQVSRTRVKGTSNTNTYVLGGDFSDYLFGMHGAMEMETNKFGDTAWKQNQQEIRVIAYADAAPRHEASFVLIDQLAYTA